MRKERTQSPGRDAGRNGADHARPTERGVDHVHPTERGVDHVHLIRKGADHVHLIGKGADRVHPTRRGVDRVHPTRRGADLVHPTGRRVAHVHPTERGADRVHPTEKGADHVHLEGLPDRTRLVGDAAVLLTGSGTGPAATGATKAKETDPSPQNTIHLLQGKLAVSIMHLGVKTILVCKKCVLYDTVAQDALPVTVTGRPVLNCATPVDMQL